MTSTGLRDRAANVATRIKGWLADSDKLSGPASSRLIGVLEDSEKIIRALLASPAPAGAWRRDFENAPINEFIVCRSKDAELWLDIREHKFSAGFFSPGGEAAEEWFMLPMPSASPAPSPATPPAEARELVEDAEAACVSLRAEVLSREHIDAQVVKVRRLLTSLRGEPKRIHPNDPYIRRADLPGLPIADTRATPPAEARELVEEALHQRAEKFLSGPADTWSLGLCEARDIIRAFLARG